MALDVDDLLKIGITAILGAISAILTYRLGRRAKVDDEKLKKVFELAEEIARLFQDITELYEILYEFYKGNFMYIDDVETAIKRYFEKPGFYDDERERIERLGEKKSQLNDKLKIARLYLDKDVVDAMQKYLEMGRFHYTHVGLGSFLNTYYVEFFKNVLDEKTYTERKKIRKLYFKEN